MTSRLNGQNPASEAFRVPEDNLIVDPVDVITKLRSYVEEQGFEEDNILISDPEKYSAFFKNGGSTAIVYASRDDEGIVVGALTRPEVVLGIEGLSRSFSSGEPVDVSRKALEEHRSYKP